MENAKFIENLHYAWECVVKTQLGMAQEVSKSEGPGLSIFEMLKKPIVVDGESTNCNYRFTDKDTPLFQRIVEMDLHHTFLLEKYDPEKMFLVAVTIPVHENQMVKVGLFEYDTLKEIMP